MSTLTVSATKAKRPSSMTLISVFEFMEGFLLLYFIFSPGIQNSIQVRGIGETIFFVFSGIVLLANGIGFWLMKKWALYVYAAYGLINQVALLALGRWNILSLLLLVIIVYVGFRYRSEMT